MDRVSQLFHRNQTMLEEGEIMLLNPPADHLLLEILGRHPKSKIWSQDFGDYCWFDKNGVEAGFGVLPNEEELPQQLILFQAREKERLEMWLHFLSSHMPSSGCLWLIGENQGGIKSAGKRLKKHFATSHKADAARHCVLFTARQAIEETPFLLEDYQQKWLLGGCASELRLVSLPGAFSHGRLDRGSELLLQVIAREKPSQRPSGSVLDFGCGVGLIGMSLLQNDPDMDLTLLDNSALALESAKRSLQANGLAAKLLASDGLSQVTERYDWIVSNPPFHKGVDTNLETSRQFFKQAHRVLKRHGKMFLVHNRHLPYQTWLNEYFSSVTKLESNSEFTVVRASQPRT